MPEVVALAHINHLRSAASASNAHDNRATHLQDGHDIEANVILSGKS
jgi:hypothetical protein